MIDVFNEVYTLLTNALKLYDESIETSSVHINMPSHFPFVSFEEIDNAVYQETSDSCDLENHAQIDYEVNIYTQSPNKKSKADNIAKVVDDLLNKYNFVRLFKNNFQSSDETKYQIIIRYQGIVSKDDVVYRR